MKPTIGIILDWQEKGSFSDFPHFVIRTHYTEAVRLAGAIPLLIPYSTNDLIDFYLDKVDGLLVPGGFYATPQEWYKNSADASPYQKTPRFEFETILMQKAIDADKPMLGICAGMQVLGGLMGCKLIPNVKKYFKDSKIEHFDITKNHDVHIEEDSILHKITNQKTITTNTHHNEAIISVTDKVKISAKTADGVIEAIEIPNKKFILGLQWHPEFLCSEEQQINQSNPHYLIFKEFISISSRNII